jgi:protein-disulfide isomerase
MNEKYKSLYVPVSILLAGFIIAGGIYLSGNRGGSASPSPVAKKTAPTQQARGNSTSFRPISADEHMLGNPNAPITILEYSDTECPFCKRFETTMQSIIDTYGKTGQVAWVYRHFPLDSIHPKTRKEAEATECANEIGGNKGFWDMLNQIYTNTPSNNGLDASLLPTFAKAVGLDVTKFNTCLASGKYAAKVQADSQDGLSAGAQGTPYSIMVLKTALTSTQESAVNNFIAQNGLASNMTITTDNKGIVLNGALPLQMITPVIDILVK